MFPCSRFRALCHISVTVPSVSSARFSKETSKKLTEQRKNELEAVDGKSKVLQKKKRSIFGTSTVPVNTNFPNPKGVPGYDPEFSVKELIAEIPNTARKQSKLLASEASDVINEMSVEKTEMLEDMGFLRHNEARIEYKFNTKEKLDLWHTGCDSDWNEGFSTCSLQKTEYGTALFSGTISTSIVKDGRVERAGWASMKLEDRKSLNRKKFLSKWRNFSHLFLKIRGDGRSYKIMLHSPLSMDFTWGDSFSYPLHTHGGPYWHSLGIVLMDRIDGPFRLEIDYIGVYNDTTHFEDFAYETYTLPLFNTHGF
ncbi:unnamed protein product [Caenorhabditis bovis]|uniref:NADH:ubiquinone oxidoreductase intermediate-associated protein 30 domain-containing protein n=1 Tax=Caenorhabditis bovis TaxID=2654633 RepID=A0A8S1DYR5_9PELO|nr:unnamed protein product [Caenorhabditis bovis]